MPDILNLAKQNLVEVPLYTLLDAARYLHVPIWIVYFASDSPRHRMSDMFERFWNDESFRPNFADDFEPSLRDDKSSHISFRSLASLFIHSAIIRPLLTSRLFSQWHPEELAHLFRFAQKASQNRDDDRRLFTESEWVLSQYESIFDRWQDIDRNHLLKLIAMHQARVELNDGEPVKLFPFSRDPSTDAPRSVVIDPEIRFGRPTLNGTPTDVLAERWRAGDSSAELADDYRLTIDEAEEGLRYEAMASVGQFCFPFPPFGW